jgi:hypothetical protein
MYLRRHSCALHRRCAAANDRFDAVVAFFSLLMLPRERIVEVGKDMHEVITSGG